MAHFAQLDENNVVINVTVVNNREIIDENGNESEEMGIEICKRVAGENTRWAQTSINHNIRGMYAGIGYTYNEENDRFYPPKPYPSWIWNEENNCWESPVPMPDPNDHFGYDYGWNEEKLEWEFILVNVSEIPKHPAEIDPELYSELYPDGIPLV
jgi:hypothetical protein